MLQAPRGIRPTAGQVVEAIFNILGERVAGAAVLDLFAGSGALGLEALSRGAARCTFVDRADASVGAVRRNLEELGYADRAGVVRADSARWAESHAGDVAQASIILLDPPYADRSLTATLSALDRAAAPGALVVAEHGRDDRVPELARLRARPPRRYGDTALTIFEVIEG